MLRKYYEEATSLIAEVILGKPLTAQAACPPSDCNCTYLGEHVYPCGSCGINKPWLATVYACWGGSCGYHAGEWVCWRCLPVCD